MPSGSRALTLRMSRRLLLFASVFAALALSAQAGIRTGEQKLDSELRLRSRAPRGHSRVIVRLNPGADAEAVMRAAHGIAGRRLASVGGQVADVPDGALAALASLPGVAGVSLDRRVRGTLERTAATIGSTFVHDALGFDGTGVGIAVIDSGVANWHDDLGTDRVVGFADFVNFEAGAYDDYGHGTHVAGIIAGSGYDSGGRQRGIAPGATLLVEKVLDASGQGYISNVIAAIDYAIANKDRFHLRVLNLSVAAGVYESYNTDPLTLAARRAVEAGLVVVSAAGNLGRGPGGQAQYGGIGAPGNAPWVLTVGASNHKGTANRSDDTVAAFSSRGPGAFDFQAKPDLVAPGVGIESLAEPGSTLFNAKPLMRLWGTVQTASEPYLSLSGTSMASPVVSGTIALMLQANPALTPNLVKAILQFTAEARDGYDGLTEGAGFLNARGAVQLAQSLAAGPAAFASARAADPTPWSGHITWGNRRLGGGRIVAAANAWRTSVMWGSTSSPEGAPIALGTSIASERVLWGTDCRATGCENVVWGDQCGGDDCGTIAWTGTGVDLADAAGFDVAAPGAARAADAVDDVLWSPPAIRRRSGAIAAMDGALR